MIGTKHLETGIIGVVLLATRLQDGEQRVHREQMT